MLIRTPKITNASGILTAQLSRFAFTDQNVWRYGSEANVTTTVRLEINTAANPTTTLVNAAAQRAAEAVGSGSGSAATTETVVATISQLVFAASKQDVILLWAAVVASCGVAGGSGASNTCTWKLRADSISGPILGQGSLTATDAVTGKGGVVGSASGTFHIFALHLPLATGFQTYVLTIQNTSGLGGTPNATTSYSLMAAAKSA